MFENPRRGRQARNFTTNVSKILDLKSSSEQIFFRKLSLGAPEIWAYFYPLKTPAWEAMRCTARRYFSSLFLYWTRPGFEKNGVVFFSFVVRFRLVMRFSSHFFCLLVRFSPQHQIFQQKRLYSSCQAFLISSCNLILFSGENIACCT